MSISTHVLDSVAGAPARGMSLRLERADGVPVGAGHTNSDGRCPELTEGLELEVGIYRLRFDTGAWFAERNTPYFYPSVELVFEVTDAAAHYHVPLLLSPFAYSTYRGS
ncbi:MAG: hydroxyisourate hydrolase [Actinomycetota bacterium]|nr:hydroxyisourate hydrolase [Actinomycetota bacterium]